VDTRAAIERFLASPGLGEATRRAYRFDLEPFAAWLERRHATLDDVDAAVLSDYAAQLGRGRPRRLAPATIGRRLAAVRPSASPMSH
jgi:site-specific recombinase XerD